jgi:hypothetical protein
VPDLSAHQTTVLLQLKDHQQKSENGDAVGRQRDRLYQSVFAHPTSITGEFQLNNIRTMIKR